LKAISDKDFKPTPKKLKEFLYGRICFRTQNYVSDTKDIKERFDTIICLSVSKWVHFNYGDLGMKTLFLKAYEQLEEGGIFIFEG
jgi:7SK snRNA methylphosphate capping enzyme